jgi:hypothetical protein
VLLVAIEQRHVGQREALAVDARLAELQLPRRREDLLVIALAAADDRREERDRVAGEVLAQALEDLAAALHADRLVAGRAMLHAELREEQAEVVRDLGDGRDGRVAAPRERRCSIATVGGRPCSRSTSGFAMMGRNWRAYVERLSM